MEGNTDFASKLTSDIKLNCDPNTHPIRLTRLETWITATATGEDNWGKVKPFLIIRLTSSEGLLGLGEAFVLPCREKAVAEIIHALGHAMYTSDTITPWAFRDMAARIPDKHRGIDYSAATSALEMALWDLTAKLANKPLFELLGGNRDKAIRVYGNIWSENEWDANALGARAAALVRKGYRVVKIHPTYNQSIQEAANTAIHVRNVIGTDIDLMIDLDSQDDDRAAYIIAPLIAPLRPYWFEEPVDGVQISALSEIREKTGLRIVTGEKQYEVAYFKSILAANAADILNPDIAGVGGLLDIMEISAMAHDHGVKISPHCWNSMTVAAAAMFHVCASIPNAEMAEIYPEYISYGAEFASVGFSLDGAHAKLPDKPGLGVDLNGQALSKCATHYQTSDLTKGTNSR